MLLATAAIFSAGVGLFIWDFFRIRPRFDIVANDDAELIARKAAGAQPRMA
jgi:hypothetical protein